MSSHPESVLQEFYRHAKSFSEELLRWALCAAKFDSSCYKHCTTYVSSSALYLVRKGTLRLRLPFQDITAMVASKWSPELVLVPRAKVSASGILLDSLELRPTIISAVEKARPDAELVWSDRTTLEEYRKEDGDWGGIEEESSIINLAALTDRHSPNQPQQHDVFEKTGYSLSVQAAKAVSRTGLGFNSDRQVTQRELEMASVEGKGGLGDPASKIEVQQLVTVLKVFEHSATSMLVGALDREKQARRYTLRLHSKKFLGHDEELRSAIQLERRVLEEVSSPYLPRLCWARLTPGWLVLGCQYFQGCTLRKYLRRNWVKRKEMPLLLAQVITAVGHLHEAGIAYRSVDLDGVFLESQGHILLHCFRQAVDLESPNHLTPSEAMGQWNGGVASSEKSGGVASSEKSGGMASPEKRHAEPLRKYASLSKSSEMLDRSKSSVARQANEGPIVFERTFNNGDSESSQTPTPSEDGSNPRDEYSQQTQNPSPFGKEMVSHAIERSPSSEGHPQPSIPLGTSIKRSQEAQRRLLAFSEDWEHLARLAYSLKTEKDVDHVTFCEQIAPKLSVKEAPWNGESELVSLIQGLATGLPQRRMGATNDYHSVLSHPFFSGISRTELAQRTIAPLKKFHLDKDQHPLNVDDDDWTIFDSYFPNYAFHRDFLDSGL